MHIKNKNSFKSLINKLVSESICEEDGYCLEEEDLDEVTTTGDIEGYETPNAFGNKKKRKKKIATNSTGYKVVNEALDQKDLAIIKKLIRDVIGDVYRDIWLKRNTWK